MKLITYTFDSWVRIGRTDGEHVTDLTTRLSARPETMIALIEQWDRLRDEVEAIEEFDHRLADVHLHAPVLRPGKLFALGLNYGDHLAEAGREPPAHQTWFTKPVTAITGPFDPIERPKVSNQLDYEVELVFIVGKRCKHVTAEEALKVI